MIILLGALAGLIAGSFVGTLVVRWPEGRSVVGGRSACDGCGAVLGPRDLVPLVSWLARRGRCATCGAAIDARHPVAEVACAIVGASALMAAPWSVAAAGMVFGWILVAAALIDRHCLWLPDRLTLPLTALGFGAALAGVSIPPLDSLIGAASGFVTLEGVRLLYRAVRGREGMGGGDPQLLMAIGAWLGWMALPFVLLLACLAALAALAAATLRGAPPRATDRMPLGTLLAIAAWPLWILLPRALG